MKNVRVRILLLLGAFVIEELMKITLAVEQSDAYNWNPQVGSRFQVIARQNTQATRKKGQALVEAEFHGKISDAFFILSKAGELGCYFIVEFFSDTFHVGQIPIIFS